MSQEDPFLGLFDDLRAEAEDKIAQAVDELGSKSIKAVIRLGDAFFNKTKPTKGAQRVPTKRKY